MILSVIYCPHLLALKEYNNNNKIMADTERKTIAVYFDLETTGVSSNSARITQLACAAGSDTEFCSYNVSDETMIGAGLYTTMLETFIGFLKYLRDCRSKTPNARIVVVAHNGFAYDFPVLYHEMFALSQRCPSITAQCFREMSVEFSDSLPTLRKLGAHLENCKLETLYAACFGSPPTHVHNALHDSRNLAAIVEHWKCSQDIVDRACDFAKISQIKRLITLLPHTRYRPISQRDMAANHKLFRNFFLSASDCGTGNKSDIQSLNTLVNRLSSVTTITDLIRIYTEKTLQYLDGFLLTAHPTASMASRAHFISRLRDLYNNTTNSRKL